ncbi:MAG: tyrosinase family protein [Acidobacteriota bacterium]
MSIEIEIHGSLGEARRFVAYAPSPCRIRQTDVAGPVELVLSSEAALEGGGEAVFYPTPDAPPREPLELHVPAGGEWVSFWLGGKWGHPSIEERDCRLAVSDGAGVALAEILLMVRVRKNANLLLPAERDRFLAAFGALNDRGFGRFSDFRSMHVSASNPQAHRGPHFLPWHRSYLLDLERELQAIDPSVSLHYWRWDEPAPNVFRRDFMGVAGDGGLVDFIPGHPLSTWTTDNTLGIRRRAHFDTTTSRAAWPDRGVMPMGQAETLGLDDAFAGFRQQMEGDPHGLAHVSFEGWISSIPTAAKDPLFFMLHANVDRLWALWQWVHGRFDPDDPASYRGQDIDGRRLEDTLWPWNGVTTPPRPDFAPGGSLASSPLAAAPGDAPTVRGMIDFQGRVDPGGRLGYGYDTVPYQER